MPTRDEEYAETVALLGTAFPPVAKALRGKNPNGRAPLTSSQLRELARAIWDHGYEYGRAHEIEEGDRVLEEDRQRKGTD